MASRRLPEPVFFITAAQFVFEQNNDKAPDTQEVLPLLVAVGTGPIGPDSTTCTLKKPHKARDGKQQPKFTNVGPIGTQVSATLVLMVG